MSEGRGGKKNTESELASAEKVERQMGEVDRLVG